MPKPSTIFLHDKTFFGNLSASFSFFCYRVKESRGVDSLIRKIYSFSFFSAPFLSNNDLIRGIKLFYYLAAFRFLVVLLGFLFNAVPQTVHSLEL
jgi:hypothetical protein